DTLLSDSQADDNKVEADTLLSDSQADDNKVEADTLLSDSQADDNKVEAERDSPSSATNEGSPTEADKSTAETVTLSAENEGQADGQSLSDLNDGDTATGIDKAGLCCVTLKRGCLLTSLLIALFSFSKFSLSVSCVLVMAEKMAHFNKKC
ncbi:hypothetical protein CDIK_0859, partial [Cucumispora dikerogammari]